MKTTILLLCTFLMVVFYACTEPSRTVPLNPNGDSELAILMRQMHENGMAMKAQIEAGKLPKVTVDYLKIKTAKETPNMKPDKMVFDLYAQSYTHTMQKLAAANDFEQAKSHYNTMITNCLNCHQKMCPGPIVRINKLKLKE